MIDRDIELNLDISLPNLLILVEANAYSGSTLKQYENICNILKNLLFYNVVYYNKNLHLGWKINENGILEIYSAIFDEEHKIILTRLNLDGKAEAVKSHSGFDSRQNALNTIIDIANEHSYNAKLKNHVDLPIYDHEIVKEYEDTTEESKENYELTESPAAKIKQQYSDKRSQNSKQTTNDIVPPRQNVRLKERFLVGDSSSKKTYTEDNFPVSWTYSDTDLHEIRVSNTISKLDVRSGQATTNDYQIVEFNSGSKITEIAPSCFMNCKRLEKVVLQENTHTFGDYAFSGCELLKSINIENLLLLNVGNYCFSNNGCENLKLDLFTCAGGTIGDNIFNECHDLAIAEIHTNNLPTSSFNNCENLTALTVVLSDLDNNGILIADESIYSMSNLKECTICGYIDYFPVVDLMPNLSSLNLYSDNYDVKILNYNFSNTPLLTTLTLGEFIDNYKQMSVSSLAKSSIKILKLLGLSYDDLLNSLDTEIYSEDDQYFKIYNNRSSPTQASVSLHTTFSYKIHDPKLPSPILARINVEENPTFYYGKIYSQLDKALEFSVKNKVPILLIGGNGAYKDADSRMLMSRKLFYEWLEQQPFIVVDIADNNVFSEKTKFKSTLLHRLMTDMASVYTLDFHTVWSKPPYSYLQLYPFAENRKNYTFLSEIYSFGYSDGVYLYKWDNSSQILNFKGTANNNESLSSIYKFYKTNTTWLLKKYKYDLKTGTFLQDIWTKDMKGNSGRRIAIGNTGERWSPWVECIRRPNYLFNNNYDWPYLNILQLIIPKEDATIETTTYKDNSYIYKENKTVYYDLFKDVVINSVLNVDTYLILFHPAGTLTSVNPYYVMYGDKSYADYLKTVTKYNDYGQALSPIILSNEYKEAVQKYTTFTNTYIKYACHYDKGVKNALKQLDLNFKNLLKDYIRNAKFNSPDYVKKDIDLDYLKTENVPFNCWGIDHDCEIWTSDHIKAKWTYATLKLTKIGKW